MTIKETQQFVYNFFYEKKLPHNTICAIMGNIQGENASWNTEGVEVGGYGGYGLCQWTFGRKTQLVNYGTDLKHQCNFLYSELTGKNLSKTGANFQWIGKPSSKVTGGEDFYCSIDDFLKGNKDIATLTKAFCYCWERPAYATNHLHNIRIPYAKKFKNTFSYNGSRTNAKNYDKNNTTAKDYDTKKATAKQYNNSVKIEKFVKSAVDIANDNVHGYDQNNRWSPDFDCSSLTITCLENANIKVKKYGASYTGDMGQALLKAGFEVIENKKYKRGDILLIAGEHVCIYIGDNKIVNASYNELGTATGGQTGDQTGTEICVRSYYNDNWTCYRLPHTTYGSNNGNGANNIKNSNDNNKNSGNDVKNEGGTLWDLITDTTYNVKQLTDNEVDEIKSIDVNGLIRMIHTFNHNKQNVGTTFTGKRIVFDDKIYKVINVTSKGFVTIKHNKGYIININPKYIKRVRVTNV